MEYLALLLLVVLACPVMMGVMMWRMRGSRPAPPAEPDGGVQEEIAILQAEITTLRADADRPDRPENTPT